MGSIKTANGLFEEVDFKWIQHVIENNKAALFHDDKVEMQQVRLTQVKEKNGFDFKEYVVILLKDV